MERQERTDVGSLEHLGAAVRAVQMRVPEAQLWHSGGGVMGIGIRLGDGGAQLFWGVAEETWGADVTDDRGEFVGYFSTNIPVERTDDALAKVVERSRRIAGDVLAGRIGPGVDDPRPSSHIDANVVVRRDRHGDWFVNLRAPQPRRGDRDEVWDVAGLGVGQSVDIPCPPGEHNRVRARAHYVAATAGIAIKTVRVEEAGVLHVVRV